MTGDEELIANAPLIVPRLSPFHNLLHGTRSRYFIEAKVLNQQTGIANPVLRTSRLITEDLVNNPRDHALSINVALRTHRLLDLLLESADQVGECHGLSPIALGMTPDFA
jgi:hypothetical protein